MVTKKIRAIRKVLLAVLYTHMVSAQANRSKQTLSNNCLVFLTHKQDNYLKGAGRMMTDRRRALGVSKPENPEKN